MPFSPFSTRLFSASGAARTLRQMWHPKAKERACSCYARSLLQACVRSLKMLTAAPRCSRSDCFLLLRFVTPEARFSRKHTSNSSEPQAWTFSAIQARLSSRAVTRGGTHFTPAALARTVVEQTLSEVEGLAKRKRLTILDLACGSGAFHSRGNAHPQTPQV